MLNTILLSIIVILLSIITIFIIILCIQYVKYNFNTQEPTKETIQEENEQKEKYIDVFNMTDKQIQEIKNNWNIIWKHISKENIN